MYNQYADDIFRFLFVHVRNTELAEDLTADTFLKAWNNIDKFDWRHGRAWLYTIARNNLADHWRKHKPLPLDEEVEIPDDREPASEALDKKLDFKRAAKALARLPEDMKSVVTLRFLQGYSVRETAQALGISESNVRVVQFRALKKLRKQLS